MAQILRDDTALGVLPAVLERLVAAFGLHAALAFQPSAGQPATLLAAYPADVAEPALLAKLGALSMAQRGAPVQLTLAGSGSGGGPGGGSSGGSGDARAASALLAYSAPADGQCLCVLALIGDAASWDEEVRATAHAVAAIVATQIRHANDLARLAERQALTRALITGAPIAILAFDAGGAVIEFNPAAEKLSGFRRDEVLGRGLADFLVPERFRPRFRDHLRTFVETGDPEEFTGQMHIAALRADGTERIMELTPVQITLGGATIFTGFLRDLTEIERSHAALADQSERLNCLIATAIPGVLITDEQGRITHVSRSFGAMFGLDDPAALVGTSALAVVRRINRVFADPVGFTRQVGEVLRARQPMSGKQIESADGRTIASADVPTRAGGSSSPNMAPKLRLTCVIRPRSSVMSTPGMAAAITQLSRSV
ncbi:MAG: PAS domain-containing protein [Streptosporangiaceae bacterium]